MVLALLLGLLAIIIAVVVISAVVHVLYVGFIFVLVAGVTFLLFRAVRSRSRYR
jgi:hypothetical protein